MIWPLSSQDSSSESKVGKDMVAINSVSRPMYAIYPLERVPEW